MTGTRTAVPLYRRVYTELRRRIDRGTYGPGASLPSERALVDELGVSQITVRRAMDELALDGLIERRQGVGTFVRGRARGVTVGVSSFTTDVVAGRLRLVRALVRDETAAVEERIAARLGLQPRSRVRHLSRLDSEGGSPLSIDEVFVVPRLARDIDADTAASASFLHLWRQRAGIELAMTELEVSVTLPDESDQRLLSIGAETPLIVTEELICGPGGTPAAWVVTRYRGDRTRLRGTFEARK